MYIILSDDPLDGEWTKLVSVELGRGASSANVATSQEHLISFLEAGQSNALKIGVVSMSLLSLLKLRLSQLLSVSK